eukprot:366003-Chlamydomonas_euryale.AAC.4
MFVASWAQYRHPPMGSFSLQLPCWHKVEAALRHDAAQPSSPVQRSHGETSRLRGERSSTAVTSATQPRPRAHTALAGRACGRANRGAPRPH